MKAVTRAITVLLLAVAVGIGWQWVGKSGWAAGLDVASAGEQFTTWIEPFAMLAGWLLIAIPAVMLIRSAWTWFDVHVLGHAPRRGTPHPRSDSHQLSDRRTGSQV